MFVIWGKRKAVNCISAKQINELQILVPLSCYMICSFPPKTVYV